jgi:hypothetical protein
MANEPMMGQSPGTLAKVAKAASSASPGGIIKTIIADLIAEHGYDAVRYVFDRLRPKKTATDGTGAAVVLALVALGSQPRGRKRRRR